MWGTCYGASNNIHFDFPPIMQDGRNYSSWQPEAVVNDNIRKQENIKSNWEYRKFLTNNAMQIMKYNNQEACNDLGLPSHIENNNNLSTNVPFLYKSVMDTNKPGYGYCNSNLKSPYLSREQLQSRMVSPSINFKNLAITEIAKQK